MYFLVILAFLGQITGETFFHRYENANFTLMCNETGTNRKMKTVWYKTEETLGQFKTINCSTPFKRTIECAGKNKKSDNKCTNQLSNAGSQDGGVFACEQFINTGTSQTCPLFTNVAHCKHYNFFFVVIINMTADETFETSHGKSHHNHSVQEESNITLSCEFQTKPVGQTFIIYWIKYSKTSKCLSSVQTHLSTFSYNTHCCIDEAMKGRLLNYTSLDSSKAHVVHNMTILNVTDSDNGTYLCVVNTWSKGKHVWKILSNLSIEVRSQAIPSSAYVLYATIGLIVGIIIISVIAWLSYKKTIKSKGKPSAQLPRAQAALEIPGDECSPYAVSSSKDLERNEVLYSLPTSPYEDPNTAYCTVDNTAASGKGPGNEMQTVYAVMQQ